MLYSSNLKDINNAILRNEAKADNIYIISSDNPQNIDLLKKFPNVEEVLCPINLRMDDFPELIKICKSKIKWKNISFVIDIPTDSPDDRYSVAASIDKSGKKRRLKILSPYVSCIKNLIPSLFTALGKNVIYMNIKFMVSCQSAKFTSIFYKKGILIGYNEKDLMTHLNNLVQVLNENGVLNGFYTDGDKIIDISNLNSLNEITIIPTNYSDSTYLKKLVSMTKTINITYTPDTIDMHQTYSEILLEGSAGNLVKINAIVPLIDIDSHILNNPNLEEISVIIHDNYDVDSLSESMTYHNEREILYKVYYHRDRDSSCYWNKLIKCGDVIFIDIIKEFTNL